MTMDALPMASADGPGGRARDPVCGMMVDPARAAAHAEHGGATYHFCSAGCAQKFRADPARYLNGTGKASMGMADGGATASEAAGLQAYKPLALVLLLILTATVVLAWKDPSAPRLVLQHGLAHFMAGFFLVFAGFKLLDLAGFAEGYATYDLLASRVRAYGFAYPFIELGFGLAMLANVGGAPLLWAEVAVMAFSGLGVALKLARHEPFTCACLGTFLKVPLTKVTLVEDFGMATLAGALLLLR